MIVKTSKLTCARCFPKFLYTLACFPEKKLNNFIEEIAAKNDTLGNKILCKMSELHNIHTIVKTNLGQDEAGIANCSNCMAGKYSAARTQSESEVENCSNCRAGMYSAADEALSDTAHETLSDMANRLQRQPQYR